MNTMIVISQGEDCTFSSWFTVMKTLDTLSDYNYV
jgi:hypothetical protein